MRCQYINPTSSAAGEFGVKVEVKNLNSFRFLERAIEYEIDRQTLLLENGEPIIQETRLWDEHKSVTRSMRGKEGAADYRYFPDPDLVPVIVDPSWISRIAESVPELPAAVRERFASLYKLDAQFCQTLSEDKATARYLDRAVTAHFSPKLIANWITTEVFSRLNRENLTMENCPVSPENLGRLIRLIEDGTISGKIAKGVFEEMFESGSDPDSIIEEGGLKQLSDPEGNRVACPSRSWSAFPIRCRNTGTGRRKCWDSLLVRS